jgi:adenylate cyclase
MEAAVAMGKEIERKFLVTGNSFKDQGTPRLLKQGYICNSTFKAVRVRIDNTTGFITIKGATKGITRPEYEYEIPLGDAKELLENFCDPSVIEKVRYEVVVEGYTWEVDEFLGDNAGLIVAEIELNDETETCPKPAWVGEEVTDDPRYLNSNLAKKPYKSWERDGVDPKPLFLKIPPPASTHLPTTATGDDATSSTTPLTRL